MPKKSENAKCTVGEWTEDSYIEFDGVTYRTGDEFPADKIPARLFSNYVASGYLITNEDPTPIPAEEEAASEVDE